MMLKISSSIKSEFSHLLKRCLSFEKRLTCASQRLVCCNNIKQLHSLRSRKQFQDVSLFGRFVHNNYTSVRLQSNTTDIEGDHINNQIVEDDFNKPLPKDKLNELLDKFKSSEVLQNLEEYGIDSHMARRGITDFKKWVLNTDELPQDLYFVLWDIMKESAHVDDLFPFYMQHTRRMFPELTCMEDLRKISDLTQPTTWYPEARKKQRKVIYHAGPTNSGKTYQAFQRFLSAKSGVYCGPLRLLAAENFKKANDKGIPCDLITGEERKYVNEDGEASLHQTCTVEMTNLSQPYEVAVIDEIQMVRDNQRGWAFTRAFLGVIADEVHVCGEEAGVEIIKSMALDTGDTFEVRRSKRLTKVKVLDRGIDNFNRIKPGDCIVCFRKNDIFYVTKQLEQRGIEAAVIYGTLPPGAKLQQAEKFNDPNNPCKVMVATDAIGMGINLSIKRVIFYSIVKTFINDNGEKERDLLPPHSAIQIAGRAGRFNTQFTEGEVTTFYTNDLPVLKKMLGSQIDTIQKAGLAPTSDQIEKFAGQLPKIPLSDLIDKFIFISNMDNIKYFMCNMDDFKLLARMIQHIPNLTMADRYTFCCSPISKKQSFACLLFLKFVRKYSNGEPLTSDWVNSLIGYPFKIPSTLDELVRLENIFDVLDLYLWLSYRFPSMFPHMDRIRATQKELDDVIYSGVENIVRSMGGLDNESSAPVALPVDTEDFQRLSQQEGEELDRAVIKQGEKISDRLVQMGIMTPMLIQILREEYLKKEKERVVLANIEANKNKK